MAREREALEKGKPAKLVLVSPVLEWNQFFKDFLVLLEESSRQSPCELGRGPGTQPCSQRLGMSVKDSVAYTASEPPQYIRTNAESA